MDKRLLRIFELVFLLNQKGCDLVLTLRGKAIDIIDENCRSIIPNWTENIYLEAYWKEEYEDMVNGTLKVLEEKRREVNGEFI